MSDLKDIVKGMRRVRAEAATMVADLDLAADRHGNIVDLVDSNESLAFLASATSTKCAALEELLDAVMSGRPDRPVSELRGIAQEIKADAYGDQLPYAKHRHELQEILDHYLELVADREIHGDPLDRLRRVAHGLGLVLRWPPTMVERPDDPPPVITAPEFPWGRER